DVVNIAARLMSIKELEGQIIADDATHSGCINIFTHTDVGEHSVKGKDTPLHLWTIVNHVQHSSSGSVSHELCGYETERKEMIQMYLEWRNNRSKSTIFIEAASGLGKSKLGGFITKMAIEDSIPICLVQGTEIEQRTPYFGIYGMMTYIFNRFRRKSQNGIQKDSGGNTGIPRGDSQSTVNSGRHSTSKAESSVSVARVNSRRGSLASLSKSLQGSLTMRGSDANSDSKKLIARVFMRHFGEDPEMAPLLGMVLPLLKIPDTVKTARLDPQAKGNLVKSLILRMFTSFVSKHQCVFVFDDAQWIDEVSLDIILSLVKFSSQEFIVILSRPVRDSGSENLGRIVNCPKVKRLELSGLSRAAVQQIIYFTLTDVTEIGGLDTTSDEVKAIIEKSDRYHFLHIEINQEGDGSDPHHLDDSDGNLKSTPVVHCSFRHISIMNAIYESLSYSERISVNLIAAQRFEQMLTPENEESVLPSISFHYSRTKEHDKIVFYLEKLGCNYIQRCAFGEGVQTLEKLLDFLSILENDQTLSILPVRRAKWLSEMSWAYCQRKQLEKCKSVGFEALNLVTTEPWPMDEPAVKKKFVKSLLKLLKLWMKTSGGTKPLQSSSKKRGKVDPNIVSAGTPTDMPFNEGDIKEKALSALSMVSIFDPNFLPIMIENHSPHTQGHHLQFGYAGSLLKPGMQEVIRFYDSYASYNEGRGDMHAYATAQMLKTLVLFVMGEPFGSSETTLLRLSEDPNYFDPVFTSGAISLFIRRSLIFLEITEATTHLENLRRSMPFTIQDPNFYMIHSLSESWIAIVKGDQDSAVRFFQKGAEEAQAIFKLSAGTPLENLWCASIFVWLLIDCDHNGFVELTNRPMSSYHRDGLQKGLEDMIKITRFLGIKKELIPIWWSLQLFEAGLDIMKGKKKKAINGLKKKWNSGYGKRKKWEIDELQLMCGVGYGVISKYTDSHTEKLEYGRKARALFDRIGD
ncbi:hypothetical protein HDU76_006657, partial [Blyttiomyces sp. JEL0837]